MKIIKEDYSLGTQSASVSKIIEGDNGLKIKIDIKSDSYDFQSYARVSVFSDLKWNIVDTIAYSNMQTPHKLYYHSQGKPANTLAPHFSQDIQTLTTNAEAILGDNFSPAMKKTITKKMK